MLLARAGLRTLLIDRGAPNSRHAVDPRPDARRRAAALAVGAVGRDRGSRHTGRSAHVVPLRRRTAARSTSSRRSASTRCTPHAARCSIRCSWAAAGAAGAAVHHFTSVTGLLRSRDSVSGVTATTSDGRSVELRAPIVIGADGMRSTIARLVDAPFTRLGTAAPPSVTATGPSSRSTASSGTSSVTPARGRSPPTTP